MLLQFTQLLPNAQGEFNEEYTREYLLPVMSIELDRAIYAVILHTKVDKHYVYVSDIHDAEEIFTQLRDHIASPDPKYMILHRVCVSAKDAEKVPDLTVTAREQNHNLRLNNVIGIKSINDMHSHGACSVLDKFY